MVTTLLLFWLCTRAVSRYNALLSSSIANALLDCPFAILRQDFTSVVSSARQFVRVTVVANPNTCGS